MQPLASRRAGQSVPWDLRILFVGMAISLGIGMVSIQLFQTPLSYPIPEHWDPLSKFTHNPLIYDIPAWNLVQGNGYSWDANPPYPRGNFKTPGYPMFLALIYSMFGHRLFPVFVIQAALNAVLCGVTYILARKLFPQRVAFLAFGFMVLYPFITFYSGYLSPEVLTTLLLALSMLALQRAMESSSPVHFGLAGMAMGLTTLVRGTFGLLPLFVGAFLIIGRPRGQNLLRKAAPLLLGSILILAPWWAWNYIHLRRVVLFDGFTHQGTHPGIGIVLLRATWEDRGGVPGHFIGRIPGYQEQLQMIHQGPRDMVENDRLRLRLAFQNIREAPWAYLSGIPYRAVRVWISRYHYALTHLPLNLVKWGSTLVFAFGCLGIVVSRKRLLRLLPLWAPMLYISAVHMFFHIEARYSIPGRPYLLIFASVTCLWLWEQFWARRHHAPSPARTT